MFLVPQKNKTKFWLVIGVILALVVAWLLAVLYINTHFHYTGKGSRDTSFETTIYSLALTLALTLLISLGSPHMLWRLLFGGGILLSVAFICLLFYIAGFNSLNHINFSWNESLLQYLDLFPILCIVLMIIIFFRK